MGDQEKDCVLLLEEMAIIPSYDFDTRTESVIGHCTISGSNEKDMQDQMATHAMVFMVCGLTARWKQVVAYFFTGNSFSAKEVKDIIIEIIQKASECNLTVYNVTMDMGGGNQAVLREFGIYCKVKRENDELGQCNDTVEIVNTIQHPVIEGQRLTFMPDVPHVLKNIRNHLTRGQTFSSHSMPLLSAIYLQMQSQ